MQNLHIFFIYIQLNTIQYKDDVVTVQTEILFITFIVILMAATRSIKGWDRGIFTTVFHHLFKTLKI